MAAAAKEAGLAASQARDVFRLVSRIIFILCFN
jgi:hypothetical protein